MQSPLASGQPAAGQGEAGGNVSRGGSTPRRKNNNAKWRRRGEVGSVSLGAVDPSGRVVHVLDSVWGVLPSSSNVVFKV